MFCDGGRDGTESMASCVVTLKVGVPLLHVALSLLVSSPSKVTTMDKEWAVVVGSMFSSVRSYSTRSPPSKDPLGGLKLTVTKGSGRNVKNVPYKGKLDTYKNYCMAPPPPPPTY